MIEKTAFKEFAKRMSYEDLSAMWVSLSEATVIATRYCVRGVKPACALLDELQDYTLSIAFEVKTRAVKV